MGVRCGNGQRTLWNPGLERLASGSHPLVGTVRVLGQRDRLLRLRQAAGHPSAARWISWSRP